MNRVGLGVVVAMTLGLIGRSSSLDPQPEQQVVPAVGGEVPVGGLVGPREAVLGATEPVGLLGGEPLSRCSRWARSVSCFDGSHRGRLPGGGGGEDAGLALRP
jgi:hypothetical protein